ncbi:carboxymuconolactone decarboxylase family protein, partial [Rhizobium leguminosarum bv. viciae]
MPIGTNAGQNLTEPKEKPPNAGVLPLAFFHWR